ncbi:MAG: 1-acyl-sn-glycerol-3-phosphate acyltransferase [Ginsengibacter sp.]
MLYKILLLPARLAIYFYCRKIVINNKAILDEKGPLLIAANHPNSFLDAIIVSTLFKKPIYSLARGDAFSNKLVTKILTSLNMLPVYRVSEGVENLENNYITFDACQQLFRENKIVLIFSEGKCINEWHLRPLKKGSARLALTAWMHNTPLRVLPLGINYNSFRRFGKIMVLNFGNFISKSDMYEEFTSGKAINEFNDLLQEQLESLVYEISPNDANKLKSIFNVSQSNFKKILLFLPAAIGFIVHAPLYYAIHFIIKDRAKDHYDSIMVGILFLFYPLFVILLTLVLFLVIKSWYALSLLILLPFTAWSYLQLNRY